MLGLATKIMTQRKLNRKERRMLKARGIAVPADGMWDEGETVSEKKEVPMPPRKPEVVQAEYERVCGALGEKRYQLAVMEAQINQLVQQVDRLVGEAKRAAKVHDEAAAPEPHPEEQKLEDVKAEILAQAAANAEAAAHPVSEEQGHA